MPGSLLKDTTVTFTGRVLGMLLGIGVASASAWLLGPSGRGELAICLVFSQLLVLGLAFGVEMGCAYHAGREPDKLDVVLGTQLVAFILTAALIVGVGITCLRLPLSFVQKVPASALACAIVFAVSQLLLVFTTVLFMGLGRLTLYNVALVGRQAVTLLVFIVCCWIAPDVTIAVIAYIIGSLAAGLFLVLSLARLRLASKLTVSWHMVAACYKYGAKYYFGKLATMVDVQMGVIVIAMVGTTEEVGLFAAVLGLASRLWILPETLNVVLVPRVLAGQTALVGLVVRSCRVAVIATMAAACLLAVFARPIVIILLSPAFLPAVSPLLILLPGVVARCITKVLISYFIGTGRPESSSVTLAVGLAISVGLLLVLLPTWGLVGAAIAISTAHMVEAMLAMLLFTRQTGCSWWEFRPRVDDCRRVWSRIRAATGSKTESDKLGDMPI